MADSEPSATVAANMVRIIAVTPWRDRPADERIAEALRVRHFDGGL
jgi:hypothetical protein